MLDWLSGKSKDMKDESLSKFYVAVTRARYSVAFVYKTNDFQLTILEQGGHLMYWNK